MAGDEVTPLRIRSRFDRERDAGGREMRSAGGALAPGVAPDAPRRALLVIGMHRSGTSAFTRVLSLAGAELPGHLMPAGDRNPRGYFESQRIYELHEQLLEEAGSAWDDLSPFPREWLESPAAPRWVERMAETVRSEFGENPILTLKDPRIARLVPFWIRVLGQLAVVPSFVIPIRNPLDVAASLERAERIDPSKGLLLWLGHLLTAERETRGCLRSFVAYEELLRDWRTVLTKIGADLELVFPRVSRRAAAEIDEFLAGELQHHATGPDEVSSRRSVPAWVKQAFEWARHATRGEPVSSEALDALDALVRPAELAFGPVVASLEVAKRRLGERAVRLEAETGRLEVELGEQRAQLAQSQSELTRAREEVARQERHTQQIVDWVKTLLDWASRVIQTGEATADHLEVAFEAIDEGGPGVVPQVATTALRLAHQSAEAARLAEESELRATECDRLAREVASLRAESERQQAELARVEADSAARGTESEQRGRELAELRAEASERRAELATLAKDREVLRQQVRGLWQQISARDGEFAGLRQEVAGRESELARLAAELAAVQADVAAREASLARLSGALEQQRRDATASVAERDLHIAALRTRLAGLEGSRVWRALRPLRWLADGAESLFRG